MFNCFFGNSTFNMSDAKSAPAVSCASNSIINIADAAIIAVSVFVIRLISLLISVIIPTISIKSKPIYTTI